MIDLWEDNAGQLYISDDEGNIYANLEHSGSSFRADAEALREGNTWEPSYEEGEEPDLTPSINMKRVASYTDEGRIIVYGAHPYQEPIDTDTPGHAAKEYLGDDA